MHEITDDLLRKVLDGDLESFRVIYNAAGGFVYNVALRVVGNIEDAEEITQEVFLIVHHKLKDFRFQSSFKTWIYRITVNQAINYAKKNAKNKKNTTEYDENVNAVVVPPQVRNKMDQESREVVVKKLLDGLNPDQRACVVLRNLEGLSYQEIADSLGINLNTVRTRLKRAREALIEIGKEVIHHEM